ncbi:MAG: TPM domain-containing protein [Ferruginibacter sp.]|nr:TPM domain-containing protein [Ferruginibacter sp.]
MNTIKKIYFFGLLLLCSAFALAQKIPDRPVPAKLVNDFSNTLTPDQIQTLENKLVALDDATSTQIAVVIVQSTNGVTIADYNIELMRKWGVGTAKNNNGVILLIAKSDRKLDITVGYGLEGALTDATAKSIIDDVIVPNFKGNDYYRGIDQGTDAIVQAVKGEYNTPRDKSTGSGGSGRLIFFIFLIIFLFLLTRKGGGGNNGTFMSRRGQRGIADAVFWNTILNSGGGGGWSGGGGGSSGGFGGFGGGSGGGGGASGSW